MSGSVKKLLPFATGGKTSACARKSSKLTIREHIIVKLITQVERFQADILCRRSGQQFATIFKCYPYGNRNDYLNRKVSVIWRIKNKTGRTTRKPNHGFVTELLWKCRFLQIEWVILDDCTSLNKHVPSSKI